MSSKISNYTLSGSQELEMQNSVIMWIHFFNIITSELHMQTILSITYPQSFFTTSMQVLRFGRKQRSIMVYIPFVIVNQVNMRAIIAQIQTLYLLE